MDLQLIKKIAQEQNIKLDDLANKANIKRATFYNYLSGKTDIPATVLKSLSDILEIPISKFYNESILLDRSPVVNSSLPVGTGGNLYYVPLVHKYAYSGYLPGYNDSLFIDALPKIPVLTDLSIQGIHTCFEINGDSMSDNSDQSRLEGDIILCREIPKDRWDNKFHLKNKNFVLLHKSKGLMIGRISRYDGNTITLHSLNPDYDDQILSVHDISIAHKEVKLVDRNSGL